MITPEIAKKRKGGIGGSEVGAILGLSKWSSPYQVWLRKTGRDTGFTGNKYTRAGIILESAVSQYFEEETKYRIIKTSAKSKVYQHAKYDFAIGMPDRLFVSPEKIGKGVLECKTVQGMIDDVPEDWFCQLQWYLGVVGAGYGSVAWLERGVDFKYKEYEYDPEFFGFMISKVEPFWKENILKDIPPDPIDIRDVILMYNKHTESKSIEATLEMLAVHKQIVDLKALIKERTEELTTLEDTVKFAMLDAEAVMIGTKPIFTWRSTAPVKRFDKDRLMIEQPEIYKQYITEEAGSRRFLTKNYDKTRTDNSKC
jgi:predicted phage-related endonuclease